LAPATKGNKWDRLYLGFGSPPSAQAVDQTVKVSGRYPFQIPPPSPESRANGFNGSLPSLATITRREEFINAHPTSRAS